MREYCLRIGETAKIRTRWWGRSWSITFGGLLEEGTCCVVVSWTMCHNSAAYNLFLRTGQQRFQLAAGTVEILGRSPEELRFRFVGRAE